MSWVSYHGNVTAFVAIDDNLWFSSTRTTFLLSCDSHKEGKSYGLLANFYIFFGNLGLN